MKNESERLKIEIENLKEQLRLSTELNKAYSLIISNQNKTYIPYYPSYPSYPVFPTYYVTGTTSASVNLTKGD